MLFVRQLRTIKITLFREPSFCYLMMVLFLFSSMKRIYYGKYDQN